MTKVKSGDCILLKGLAELADKYEINEYNEFTFKNVDVHVTYLAGIMANVTYMDIYVEADEVDDEGDFSVRGYSSGVFFGNEMIDRVVDKAKLEK